MNIWSRIVYPIARNLLMWSLRYVYNYIDTNDDGKISKKELVSVYNKVKKFLDKSKKK